MSLKHTPTPYAFDQEADNSTDFWIFQTNGPVRIAAECSEADAAFIVRACNAHDELVAALKCINAALNQPATFPADVELARRQCAAALAKVQK